MFRLLYRLRKRLAKLAKHIEPDVFTCRFCGRKVDYRKPYHSDERGLWHWTCGG